MIIHTLGPEATDSHDAAQYYLQGKNGVRHIVLHDRFEEIINHLNNYQGECLIIPAAFKSFRNHMDWADLHYAYLGRLQLIDCFRHPLNQLVIIRRLTAIHNIAYTHPATATLLKSYLQAIHSHAVIEYTDSKYLAYQKYKTTQAHFVLTNLQNVQLSADEKIERTYAPDMVWCVYQILNTANQVNIN